MTEFAHITPTAYLDLFAADRPFHLTLAHLIEEDPVYTDWYAQRDKSRGMSPYVNVMDNSAFEMYKQGRCAVYAHARRRPLCYARDD